MNADLSAYPVEQPSNQYEQVYQPLQNLFQDQVGKSGDKIALVYKEQTLTYTELNCQANQLAHYIKWRHQERYGEEISNNTIIALCTTRNINFIIGLLAILKTGGVYFPIDTETPLNRINYLLADSKARLILADDYLIQNTAFNSQHQSYDVIDLIKDSESVRQQSDTNPLSHSKVTDLAYIIYTSGSTGKPKGVMQTHKTINNLVNWQAKNDTAPKAVMQFASIGFDVSIQEIAYALLKGHTLHILDDKSRNDLPLLERFILKHSIHTIFLPVALLEALAAQNNTSELFLEKLQQIYVSGEALIITVNIKNFFSRHNHIRLSNQYGPTETHLATEYQLPPDPDSWETYPVIGKPIQNIACYVLDQKLKPVPIGIPGELYIGGDGLAQGYLNQPNLTQERFILSPFDLNSSNSILYKTGDNVTWLPDGNLKFLGRSDNQIKIRGFRVELNEIETQLNQAPSIKQAAVVLSNKNNRKQIIAYIILQSDNTFSRKEIKNFLSHSLPSYMLPNDYIVVRKYPLTQSGKIDRKQLSELHEKKSATEKLEHRSNHSQEQPLLTIWQTLLNTHITDEEDDFFSLGGNSLLAMQLSAAIQEKLKVACSVSTIYQYPTFGAFKKFISQRQITSQSEENIYQTLPLLVIDQQQRFEKFRLSDIQQAYWIGRNGALDLGNTAIHLYLEYDQKELDLKKLQAAWNILILRHEALRLIIDDEGYQRILKEVPVYDFSIVDLTQQPLKTIENALQDIRSRLSHEVLPANQWPLFKICATRMADYTRLHLSFDALILDVISLKILFEEWLRLYYEIDLPLAPLTLSFRDYTLFLHTLKLTTKYSQDKQYWLQRIVSFPPPIPLPLLKSGSPQRFARKKRTLCKQDWNYLQSRLRYYSLSPAGFLSAVYAEILAIWSNCSHFIINLTLFNRLPLHDEINQLVGDFTSINLLEINFHSQERSFLNRVKQIQIQLWNDLDHRLFSGVEVQQELIRQSLHTTSILTPVVFTCILGLDINQAKDNHYNSPFSGHHCHYELFANEVYAISQTPQVYLDYKAYEKGEELVIEWDYVEALFPAQLIDTMHSAYCDLLHQLATYHDCWEQPVKKILPLRFPVPQPIEITSRSLLQDLFFQAAASYPDNVAVISDQGQLTYKQLQHKVWQLANQLREAQIPINQPIAILLPKSEKQIIACLGILHSGCPYLPIDCALPLARINELLIEGKISAIVTQSRFLSILSQCAYAKQLPVQHIINMDYVDDKKINKRLISPQTAEDLAYILFTSGSTGKSKGVMISHQSVVNTILDINQRFNVTSQDSVLALSQLNFDLSVYDIFGLLAVGGTVVLPSPTYEKDPEHWLQLLATHRVTLWNSVPMFMQMLLEYCPHPNHTLRLVLLSGDWIPVSLVHKIRDGIGKTANIISLGGATEASIWSIYYPIEKLETNQVRIPYGTALKNQSVYVLNAHLAYCPLWVTGELYIGGIGLAQGYWQDENKTATCFILHPETGERLYRTGDWGRYLPDGNIEFLGRQDNQVKIGGHRIELGEIEYQLKNYPGVQNAIVILNEQNSKKLVAYLKVAREKAASLFRIANKLNSELSNEKILTQIIKASENIATETVNQEFLTIWSYLEELYLNSVCNIFKRIGIYQREEEEYTFDSLLIKCGIINRYQKWAKRALQALVAKKILKMEESRYSCIGSAFSQKSISFSPLPPYQNQQTFTVPTLELIQRTAENLLEILREDYHSAELYASDEIPLIYQEQFHTCYRIVKNSINVFQNATGKHLRILELGAGYGTTTVHILPLLDKHSASYLYTDVSDFFLSYAKNKFTEYDFIDYQILDMNLDPALQGYEAHSFDIIIASSMLHNARKLSDTLQWIKALLIPNALLILVEETQFHPIFNLTMGLQQGFEEFQENEFQQDHPLLTEQQWQKILVENGFVSTTIFNQPNSVSDFLGYRVIISFGPAEVKTFYQDQLLRHLQKNLPSYMVPTSFILLNELPLTATGKINRALLTKTASKESNATVAKQPQTEIEIKVIELFNTTLNLKTNNVDSDFFISGGDSLLATQFIARIQTEFSINCSIRAIYEHRTIEKFSRYLVSELNKQDSKTLIGAISFVHNQVNRYVPFPMTEIQQAYWIGRNSNFKLGKVACHVYLEYDSNNLNINKLEAAWNILIHRHDALRLIFKDSQQSVLKSVPDYRIQVLDLRFKNKTEADQEVDIVRQHMAAQILPCDQWPLFDIRVTCFPNFYRLHLSIDALILDAWSFKIIFSEWISLYNNLEATLPVLNILFRDYVLHKQSLKQSTQYHTARQYWLTRLDDFPLPPELPISTPPEQLNRQIFKRRKTKLSKAIWCQLKETLPKDITPAGFLVATFAEILSVWSRYPRFTINMTLFDRLPLHPDINSLVGDFTSLVLLAVNSSNLNDCFLTRAKAIQSQLWQDLDHSLFSGVEVQRELSRLNPEYYTTMPVVFTCMLGIDLNGHSHSDYSALKGLFANEVYGISQTPQVCLDYKAYEQAEELVVEWDYVEALFSPELIDSMHGAYCDFLQQLASKPTCWEQSVKTILPLQVPIPVSSSEAPSPMLLQELFFQAAAIYPNNLAVISNQGQLTYKQLQHKALQLTHRLSKIKISTNQPIAILLPKSEQQIIACLGVLQSGCPYLPIDSALPLARINELLKEGQVSAIVTQMPFLSTLAKCAYTKQLPAECVIDIDQVIETEPSQHLASRQTAEDLAYILFTSGSTGRPKGVMISHQSVVNTIQDINQRFNVTHQDCILALSHLNFDLSVYDIFGLLAVGGTLVLPDPALEKDPEHWLQLLKTHQVTLWNSVPMFMQMLLEYCPRPDPTLRLILLSGDWIPISLVHKLRSGMGETVKVVSLGGATEASIWSIYYPIENVTADCTRIPYGKALKNQAVYVLNPHLTCCPVGVIGELYIGGTGLARGYWQDESRTALSFILHPETGQRLYKTGDLGRYLPDGNIEFLGRQDNQVKIGGHRIELGEIEHYLKQHPLIEQAIVDLAVDSDKKRLRCYYLLKSSHDQIDLVKEEHLRFKLQLQDVTPLSKNSYIIPLAKRGSPELTKAHFKRKSYRHFIGKAEIAPLFVVVQEAYLSLKNSFPFRVDKNQKSSPLQLLSHLLQPFRSRRHKTLLFPKYRYPSAGGLYPVKIYLCYEGYYYYYNPHHHHLLRIAKSQHTNTELYFVAKLSVVKPIYGKLAKPFCLVESGYMHTLLYKDSSQNLQRLRDRSQNKNIRTACQLDKTDVIISKYRFRQKKVPNESKILPTIYLYWKEMGWYKFDNENITFEHISSDTSIQTHLIGDESGRIFEHAQFGIFYFTHHNTQDETEFVWAGALSQLIIEASLRHNIGICPIGSINNNVIEKFPQEVQGQSLLHILYGGGITQKQVESLSESDGHEIEDTDAILHQYLSARLPDYMVPTIFINLPTLPLTKNGKIDRVALQKINPGFVPQSNQVFLPKDEYQQLLINIWKNILGVDNVGIHDNFFRLGGHSLSAIQVITKLEKIFNRHFPLQSLFSYPTIVEMSQFIYQRHTDYQILSSLSLKDTEKRKAQPLSLTQQGLWFLYEYEGQRNTNYNISLNFYLSGQLNIEVLHRSINYLISRHSSLRTTFKKINGDVMQIIAAQLTIDLPVVSIVTSVKDFIEQESRKLFNLEQGPLIRVTLLKLDSDFVFLLTLHHIICDGWSIRILLTELAEVYANYLDGKVPHLPDNRFDYVDFSQWQRKQFQHNEFNKQLKFWTKKLRNYSLVKLPLDYPRINTLAYGEQYHFKLTPSLTYKLEKLALQQHTTIFNVLLAIFNILLANYSGQNDIVVGSPVANRTHSDVENIVGFIANTLVFRNKIHWQHSFIDYLTMVTKNSLQAYANQELPFEYVVNAIEIERNTDYSPIFQVMFVLQNDLTRAKLNLPNASAAIIKTDKMEVIYDLIFALHDDATCLDGTVKFNTALFKKETIKRLTKHYKLLLYSIATHPEQPLVSLPTLFRSEKKRIFCQWNETKASYPSTLLTHQLFEQQVLMTPLNIAACFEQQKLSYQELNAKANQLASFIRSQYLENNARTIAPDKIIGVYMERSMDMLISIVAILKAGAAYLPLDAAHPIQRNKVLLEDSDPIYVLTHNQIDDELLSPLQEKTLNIDHYVNQIAAQPVENLTPTNKSNHLAYVIYTSGSTGVPKGVMVEHSSLVNRLVWMQKQFTLKNNDVVLQKTPCTFDVSVWEWLWPLVVGAKLHIASPGIHLDPYHLFKTIIDCNVTDVHFVPSIMKSFIDEIKTIKAPSLKRVYFSGEQLEASLCFQLKTIFPQIDIYNLYGPTEATIDVSCYKYSHSTDQKYVPIGKPIDNTQLYVLDHKQRPVAIGVQGELYISGVGVARGYLNNTELSKQVFMTNFLSNSTESAILYRTGDIMRWRHDGNLEFIGRQDQQIKLYGVRFEATEVELVIDSYPGIKQSRIILKSNNHDSKLIAYYVRDKDFVSSLSINDLHDFLAAKLPKPMIPTQFVELTHFPLTANGKIDRKKLINDNITIPTTSGKNVALTNHYEAKISAIWKDILAIDSIGVHDNFFAMGGRSLTSVKIAHAISETLQVNCTVKNLFAYPTISSLARYLEQPSTSSDTKALHSELVQDAKLSSYSLPISHNEMTNTPEKSVIFLTGATGFVGIHLLAELVKQTRAKIYCLIRNHEDRLRKNIEDYFGGQTSSQILKRIVVISGDLSLPLLGLTEQEFNTLSKKIDIIYHCGAVVNHILPYHQLRASNVLGTVELARMAMTYKTKPIHFISTLNASTSENGYSQTKWVAEKLLTELRMLAVPVTIYQLGRITGHSQTGKCSFENNHLLLLIKGCLQFAAAPRLSANIDMLPVDYLARIIVKISLQGKINSTYPIYNTNLIPWQSYIAWFQKKGYKVELVSYSKWIKKIKTVDPTNALYPLLPFYLNAAKQSLEKPLPALEKNIEQFLTDNQIQIPLLDDEILSTYYQFLQENNFL